MIISIIFPMAWRLSLRTGIAFSFSPIWPGDRQEKVDHILLGVDSPGRAFPLACSCGKGQLIFRFLPGGGWFRPPAFPGDPVGLETAHFLLEEEKEITLNTGIEI
jgi:hypothetical protein